MALRSRFAFWLWYQTTGASNVIQDISALIDSLTFTTLAPGGYGQLSVRLYAKLPRVPNPQYGLFARLAIMAGTQPIWLGEVINPSYTLEQNQGEFITIVALGLGNALRDDPANRSYTNSTAQSIARDQLTLRTVTHAEINGVISTDNTQLFPDNPAQLITEAYGNRTFEEVLSDVSVLVGDYNWGVEADPVQKDSAGFPLGRVFARKRVLTSQDYQLSLKAGDVESAVFTASADHAYNYIEISYTNASGGVGTKFAKDSRLNSDLSQGKAAYRYRKYTRDLSGLTTVNGTIAQNIANAQLANFQDPSYKGTIVARQLRDGYGNQMPLWSALAGYNVYVPELAISGKALPQVAQQNVNLFWITQTTYTEDTSGARLQMDVGYLPLTPDIMVARLQMAADAKARSGQTAQASQVQGASMQGQYGFDASNGVAGQTIGQGVTFPALGYQAPTSISFNAGFSNNLGALSANTFSAVGCNVFATVSANGAASAGGTYTTNGNCLRHVNHESGRFAKHCDSCDMVTSDLEIGRHALAIAHYGAETPGRLGLTVICPACGVAEAYNTGLSEADEQGSWSQRAEQARLIRALLRALGKEVA